LVRSARVHRLVREAARFGTTVGTVGLDWAAVVRRQQAIVEELRPSVASLERIGARVYLGEGRFADARTVTVDGARVAGEKVIIAAGSTPVVPRLPGVEATITSDDLLFLPEFPRRLVLIGAGAIGLEMAGAFRDLGAEVTVLDQEPEILPAFDPDVARYLRAILEGCGVAFRLGATVSGFAGRRGDVTTRFAQAGTAREVQADHVCVAVGRRFRPNLIGAEALGLDTGPLGLRVTPHLRTSVSSIYAAGDAAGNLQLTPVAAYEGRVAARNALEGDRLVADHSAVPQTIFTTPEVARVGLTHAEARARGVECHVSTHDLRGASNGRATGEDDGYLKLVFEGQSERVLGVQMVSYAAAELIQLAALAIRAGATAELLSTQLSVHPSHGERFIKIAAHDYHEVCEVPPAV
jgi:pyruvate/2-oxoglutarate dehydrogenase complex dihydrolipoamide dehydrogenase (E3) component